MEMLQRLFWVFLCSMVLPMQMHGADQSPAAYRHCKGKAKLVRLKPLPEETSNWIDELKLLQQRVSCDIKRREIGGLIFNANVQESLDIKKQRELLQRMMEHN